MRGSKTVTAKTHVQVLHTCPEYKAESFSDYAHFNGTLSRRGVVRLEEPPKDGEEMPVP
ncbi:uncharacterized protein H6S33_007175 [Morchella sextelata]|uniref:uncharacterized protein n=1 Tax=Morchella sextelata TaxID=1174677 RepID=UPI001D05389C|nr:uncharacterized protein H6S33_007175 [Morchella sextelata]KAH0604144.1 hypothetical protein H6S33_007175 [Morchella sextelata]